MLGNSSFLSDEDRTLFDTPGRVISRSVTRNSSYDRSRAADKPIRLADAIAGQLVELSRLEQNRFRCCCVTVGEDDGMSWSAETVSRAIETRFPQYRRYHLDNRVETKELPAIAKITGDVALFKLAAKAGLIKSLWFARPWLMLAFSGLLVLLGAAGKIIEALSKTAEPGVKESPAAILGNLGLLAGLVAAAAVAAAARWVEKKQDLDPRSKINRNLRESLEENHHTTAFGKLASDMAQRLNAADFPRVVIIDRYEALDGMTQTR